MLSRKFQELLKAATEVLHNHHAENISKLRLAVEIFSAETTAKHLMEMHRALLTGNIIRWLRHGDFSEKEYAIHAAINTWLDIYESKKEKE